MNKATVERCAELVANYEGVLARITKCATSYGRNASEIRLLPVSKYKPAEDILALHEQLNIEHFGENYVQELVSKASTLPKTIKWHFIGALQKNKIKDLAKIENLYMLETASDYAKMKKLNDLRQEGFPKVNILLQINTLNEEQKAGLLYSNKEAIVEVVKQIVSTCPNLVFKGFMTIGSIEESTKTDGSPNKDFQRLVEIRDAVKDLEGVGELELSMGMSNDFEEAIRQGSTQVRVGTAIFGARYTK